VTGGPRTLNENGQRVSGGQTFGANLSDSALAYAKEAEPWPTPVVNLGRNATSGRKEGSQHHDGVTIHDAVYEWPARDSDLWPVTLSAPGRVAKLKAIGNAVVPAWVVAGPFAYIIQCEEGA